MEEPENIKLKPANENVYYRIAMEGKRTWNRWIRRYLDNDAIKASGLEHESNLDHQDLERLARVAGVTALPSPDFANFRGLLFSDDAEFDGYVFLTADFSNSVFEGAASFMNASFIQHVMFRECRFEQESRFYNLDAQSMLSLAGSVFESDTDFSSSTINFAQFSQVKFAFTAYFTSCKFMEAASFDRSIFLSYAMFGNSRFEGSTSFTDAAFSEVPYFHESTLHQDTSFYGAVYTLNPSNSLSHWHRRSRAWRTLKQKMHSFQSYQEELFFFAKELDARARSESNTLFLIAVTLYDHVCEFGVRILYPIVLLLGLSGIFTAFYSHFLKAPSILLAMSVSLSNTLPFAGQSRLLAEATGDAFAESAIPVVFSFSILQSLLSAMLLFLILLGIRNHFRLK